MEMRYLILFFAILMTLGSCNKVVGPHYATQPGSRDYTWQVDTIKTPQTNMRAIDGVSDSDAWAISSAGDFRFTIFHFNGETWLTDSVDRPLSPNGIRVFSSSDAWIVGQEGEVWRYDGTGWTQQAKIPPPLGATDYFLEDVNGYAPTNLYAVGEYFDSTGNRSHSLIYRLSGDSWSRVNIQSTFCTLYKIVFLAPESAFIVGVENALNNASMDTSKIFEFNGMDLHSIYSAPEIPGQMGDVARVPDGVVILEGGQLSYYDGSTERMLTNIQSSEFGGSIAARTTEDVFLGMLNGVAQYNGTDVQYLLTNSSPNIRVEFIKVFPNSLFVLAHDYSTGWNLVYRGYLPK